MRRGGTWLASASAVLALAACGGGDDARPEEPTLPRGLAERLAQESEGIADKLEAGDQCGAAEQADVLEDAVEQAIADGDVPDEFQAELSTTARKLQKDVNCPQPEPPAPTPDCDALEEEKQALEEEKQALEEQKEDADEDERAALDEQIQALDEQKKTLDEEIKECKKGEGNGEGEG